MGDPPANQTPTPAVAAAGESQPPAEIPSRLESAAGVWARIKEHKLIQWGLAYLGAALALAHGQELLAHTFEWPEIFGRIFLGVLVLGFPVALTFAWYHGHKGARRLSAGEMMIVSLLLVIAGGLLTVFVRTPEAPVKQASEPAAVPQVAAAPQSPAPTVEAVNINSIAVLPFVDMSEKKDQEYFTDGLSEELIDLVSKVPELRVTARTSSFYFKGRQATIPDIAKALNVAHVLEGSVRKSGNELRITAQLIRCDNGYHVWSETYDRKMEDIFKVQDDIAGAVVKALKVSLLGDQTTERPAPTTNTEAYALYLQGRALIERYTPADVDKGTAYMREAVKLDPNFAQAWAMLGGGRSWQFGLFATETNYEAYRRDMVDSVHRALALDPNLAYAHAQLGFIYWTIDRNIPAAEREYTKALALDSADVAVLGPMSFFRLSQGRLAEAEKLGTDAVVRDPLALESYRALGTAQYFGGKLSDAETTFRHAIVINPDADGMHYRLAFVLISAGRAQDAVAEAQREPSEARRKLATTLAYDALGRRADSDKALGDVEQLAKAGWYYQLAEIFAQRADKDQAFHWLGQAFDHHDGGIYNYLVSDPLLQPLRSDPRYKALLQKLQQPV